MKNILSKNSIENYNPEKITRYSIRKASFGATSVAVAAFFMYLGQGSAAAADNNIQNQENKISSTDENKNSDIENTVEKTSNETVVKSTVAALDKTKLSSLTDEIESKIVSGAYDSKTEDSVAKLRVELGTVKTILENAKTQEELTRAYNKLITATTQLKTKPEEKKEAPAVNTTNGKSTVGIKATNTEKTTESNSIANSGSKDERNGKALDKNNPFRTDATTANTDPAANQTYTAPAADANLETLSNELKNLPNFIENNKKIQDMDTLGNALNVEKGSVTEINEFGGWKAVGDSGKFAIARKTGAGVFPIETVNTVWQAETKTYQTWVLEQSFNRDSDYMLFLSKVRTQASRNEEAFDNSPYISTGEGRQIARGVKGFDGIQKTFKAYSKEHGSKVIVSFKTGYTGDIDGTKAKYKVEVIVNRNGQEEKLYDQTFTPEVSKTNSEMTVVKASDGTNRPQNFITPGTPTPTKAEFEAKIANNKPNGTGGTFTSKEITLPEGVTEYTVRISSADNLHLGMGYQSLYRHYALPVTGLDFNIDQDTGTIAKDLLSRIYDKLKATETADTDGKTNETKAAYLAELENIKTLVTSTDVKKTAEYKTALESVLSKQLALKVDKTGLTNSKTLLDGLVNEDPTPGKTQDTATAYTAAKQEAVKAIEAAKKVIDNENATVTEVREALAIVNGKKTSLEAAKQALVEAATAEEKAKLKTDADSLVKADTTGKTPNSIEAYNRKYEELKAQLEAAKTEAAAVLAKGNNASKAEVQAAQAKVDEAKVELTKAAELLVNKADKTELTNAKDALNTLATEADPTPGKTADSAKAYNDAKTAAQEAIREVETVINDENATTEQVSAALNKVNEKKSALEAAKQALVEAATTEEKAKLKSDADSLVKADTTGKTPNSIEAYNRKYEELKAQLEAAKTEAAAVLAKGNNASKAEVQAAQAKVDEAKVELTKAAELLVNKADKTELTNAKDALNTLATEADPTPGKTADSAKTYNDAKAAAQEAIQAAETVINDENATPEKVTEALNKVSEKKAALEAAKQALVEAATAEEKAKLKADADSLTKADETGKTPDSIAVYERKYEELKTQLEAAKAAVTEVEAKGNNATKEEVKAAQTKVDSVKAELTKAAELLKDKADKTELTQAKEALSTLATEADPTTEKTADSAKAYNDAKTAAQDVIQAANTVIDDENATPEQVTEALNKVNEKKVALEAAKQALVEAATAEEKAKLKADADSLVKADTTGKTPNSIEAYNRKYEELKTQLEAAKSEAAAVLAKENNASKAEVKAAQTKIDAVKAELTKAAELLVNKADKTELTKAKVALNTLATEADPTTGKTADSAKAYNDAKTAATEAIKAAELVINDENATQDQVTEALSKVNEKKAALEAAKQALVEAATVEEKAKLKTDADSLVKADTTGKTPNSIEAYNRKYEELKAQLEAAKTEAAAVLAKGNNATKEEVKAAQAKVEAVKTELENAKTLLVEAATTEEKIKLKADADSLVKADTTGKTPESIKEYEAEYEKLKAQLEEAKAEAAAVEAKGDNATKAEAQEAQAKVDAVKKALEKAAELLKDLVDKTKLTTEATTDAEETKGSSAYYNADEAKKAAYDKALAEAKKVLENDKATQVEVNAALKALEEAKAALNGQPTNKDALTKAATTDAEETKGSPAYYNADEAKKAAYDKALEEAKKVLVKANATQTEVDAALKALEEAKAALNGQPTNKDALTKAATTDAEETKGSPAYYNADEAKKAAYDKALEEAKKVLAKANATQAEVDAALKALEEAKAALNGYVSYKINPAINEVEEFDISELIVKGIVEVEKGQTINENDIKSKLNLPDGIEIVEIEYPDTTTLGRKIAKIVLRGNDGHLFTIEVPIEVVEGKVNNNLTNGNDTSVDNGSGDIVNTESLKPKDSKDTNKNIKFERSLPNTGSTESNTGLAGLGITVLAGLLTVVKRRKEK